MKDYCSVQLRGLSYCIGIIVCGIITRDVKYYVEASKPGYLTVGGPCVPGQDGVLDNHALDTILSWMPDEFKNPDDICVTRLGAGSTLCREEYDGNYSRICGGMWCRDPLLETCSLVSANDGVSCGDQKWCFDGECRYSDQAIITSESCPFGDSSTFSSEGLSCEEMVLRDRKICYDKTIEQICCQSCRTVSMNRQGCRYGDWVDGCRQADCLLMTFEQIGRCCQTCGFFVEIIPTEQPTTTRNTPSSASITKAARTSMSPVTTRTFPDTRTTATGPRETTPVTQNGQTTTRGKQTTTAGVVQKTTDRQTTSGQQTRPTTAQTRTNTAQTRTTTDTIEIASTAQETTQDGQTPTKPIGQSQPTMQSSETTSQQPRTSQPFSVETPPTPAKTTIPEVTPSDQPTTAKVNQTSEITSQTQPQNNNFGTSDTQQANQNAVAIGTGVGIGALVLVVVVVTIVYVIRKKAMTPQPRQNNPSNDNESVGGDSLASLTATMSGTSTTWYPNYRSTHTME